MEHQHTDPRAPHQYNHPRTDCLSHSVTNTTASIPPPPARSPSCLPCFPSPKGESPLSLQPYPRAVRNSPRPRFIWPPPLLLDPFENSKRTTLNYIQKSKKKNVYKTSSTAFFSWPVQRSSKKVLIGKKKDMELVIDRSAIDVSRVGRSPVEYRRNRWVKKIILKDQL